MQDDQLLSGSIADNICFFDTTFDMPRMIECAQLAGATTKSWLCR
jgi:ATP-binding cassette subfamily B protein RaxB